MQEMKEWTIMFYFASDNPLAPGIIAQMKSIKYAGFHPQANVIAQFDPNTVGAPTHIFDVNHIAKLKKPNVAKIGFKGNDPFVRNMIEDKLWRDQKSRDDIPIRDKIKKICQNTTRQYRRAIEARRPLRQRVFLRSRVPESLWRAF